MGNYRWTCRSCAVLAGAIVLGLAPLARIRVAIGDYNYYEDIGRSEDGEGSWSYASLYGDVWCNAIATASAGVRGSGSQVVDDVADAWAGMYYLWLWEEPGSPPGGYLYYGYEVNTHSEQCLHTRFNDVAHAEADTSSYVTFQNYAYPLGMTYEFVEGSGVATDGDHMILWGGPATMTIDSEYYEGTYYGVPYYDSREVAEWSVSVDDEGPVGAGQEEIAFSLSVDASVSCGANAQSGSDFGYADAVSSSSGYASAEGYAEFYSN